MGRAFRVQGLGRVYVGGLALAGSSLRACWQAAGDDPVLAVQGACQTSGQAIQAHSAAQALQAAQQRVRELSSPEEQGSDRREGLPEAMQRQIVAGRRVIHALVALNVSVLLTLQGKQSKDNGFDVPCCSTARLEHAVHATVAADVNVWLEYLLHLLSQPSAPETWWPWPVKASACRPMTRLQRPSCSHACMDINPLLLAQVIWLVQQACLNSMQHGPEAKPCTPAVGHAAPGCCTHLSMCSAVRTLTFGRK